MKQRKMRALSYNRVGTLDQLDESLEPQPSRVWAYGRASTSMQIASPETQKSLATNYARNVLGREIDGVFLDRAVSGKKPINEREAGRELMAALRPGDILIVARLDRLARSFVNFVQILESIEQRGVFLHILDIPGGVFDPSNAISKLISHILGAFAEYQRKLISISTKEGLHARRERGERHTRYPGYGFKWEDRVDPRTGKKTQIKVACEKSRATLFLAVEMRSQGKTLDQIREHFSYKLGIKRQCRSNNPKAGATQDLTRTNIQHMIETGMRLLVEAGNGVVHAETVDNLERGRVTNLEP